MAKKNKVNKTLVEKILDQKNVAYKQYEFATKQAGDVQDLDLDSSGVAIPREKIYKTLALIGDKTGPIVGVLPITEHLSYKKISQASGNKKTGMIPLKDLVKTTGYEHGANTPVGIHEMHHFPIYIDAGAENKTEIIISAGKIGRSVGINPKDLAKITDGKFADLRE